MYGTTTTTLFQARKPGWRCVPPVEDPAKIGSYAKLLVRPGKNATFRGTDLGDGCSAQNMIWHTLLICLWPTFLIRLGRARIVSLPRVA